MIFPAHWDAYPPVVDPSPPAADWPPPDDYVGYLYRADYRDHYLVEYPLCPVDHWEIVEKDWLGKDPESKFDPNHDTVRTRPIAEVANLLAYHDANAVAGDYIGTADGYRGQVWAEET